MDAVKIIKKHGSPGGIPTLTAYVDPDAPGELPTPEDGDAGKAVVVNDSETGYELKTVGGGGSGLNTFALTLTNDQVGNIWESPFALEITNYSDFDDLFAADVILLTVPGIADTVPELKVYLYKQAEFGDDFLGIPLKFWQAFYVPVTSFGGTMPDTFNVTIDAEDNVTPKIKIFVTKATVSAGNSLVDLLD